MKTINENKNEIKRVLKVFNEVASHYLEYVTTQKEFSILHSRAFPPLNLTTQVDLMVTSQIKKSTYYRYLRNDPDFKQYVLTEIETINKMVKEYRVGKKQLDKQMGEMDKRYRRGDYDPKYWQP